MGKRERGKGRGKRGGLRGEERGMAEGRVKAGGGLNVKGGEKGEGYG